MALKYLIVGSGYRSEYYGRIAFAWPELFNARYLVRSPEKAALIKAHTGCDAYTDLKSALSFGPLRLDPDARSVSAPGADVRLTRTEYAILKLLIANPSQVATKSRLLDEIGQDTPDCTESSLKTHVSNLRRKLRDAGAGDCIESVWGIGFKMKTE